MKLPNLLIKRAYLTPHRIAYLLNGQEITYSMLYERSHSVAGKLANLSIKKDDNIAVLLKNHIDTVYILLALQLLGCKAVLLNNRLTLYEMEWQIKDSQSTLLITDTSTEVKELISTSVITKSDLFMFEEKSYPLQDEINLESICSIMYTSGTTGNPKGVLQSYGNHWWSATGSAFNLGISESDKWICTVPLFHISGYSILMRGLIYGMTVILHENFDEGQILKDIQTRGATIISVVTTMVTRLLLALKDEKLPSSFRCMLAGGGPIAQSILEECVSKNIPVFQTYGMTETASQVVTLSPEDSLTKLGSAGKPLFPVQLKIVNSEGNEVKQSEAGEIIIKGPNVTTGYLNRPAETNEKIKNGWLSTGDIGYVDEDGFLFVLDRRSDLIISGGENIYPAEIEGILLTHDSIIDVGVIGISDDKWGQVPIAILVKAQASTITSEGLKRYCEQRLAKYKVPKRFLFVDELPRNAARKLMRHKLKEWWEESQSEH